MSSRKVRQTEVIKQILLEQDEMHDLISLRGPTLRIGEAHFRTGRLEDGATLTLSFNFPSGKGSYTTEEILIITVRSRFAARMDWKIHDNEIKKFVVAEIRKILSKAKEEECSKKKKIVNSAMKALGMPAPNEKDDSNEIGSREAFEASFRGH